MRLKSQNYDKANYESQNLKSHFDFPSDFLSQFQILIS